MKRLIRPTGLTLIVAFIVTLAGTSVSNGKNEGEDRPEVAKQIKTYLRTNFGMKGYETSWYANIRNVSVSGKMVIMHTDLSDGDRKARNICSAASGFVFSNENRSLGLSQVRVDGANGQVLIYREQLGDPCA